MLEAPLLVATLSSTYSSTEFSGRLAQNSNVNPVSDPALSRLSVMGSSMKASSALPKKSANPYPSSAEPLNNASFAPTSSFITTDCSLSSNWYEWRNRPHIHSEPDM